MFESVGAFELRAIRAPLVGAWAVACAALAVLVGWSASADHSAVAPVKQAASPARGLTALPAGLRPVASSAVGAARAGFAVRHLHTVGGGLATTFGRSGPTVHVGGSALKLNVSGVGRGETFSAVRPADPVAAHNQVVYRRGAVTEWYRNGPLGLEQGFTLRQRPASSAGWLTISERVSGLQARQSGAGVVFSRGGRPLTRLDSLSAVDARGRALPSRFQVSRSSVLLRVDDAGAAYPVKIDPMVQQGGNLFANDETGFGDFGTSVALSSDGSTALIGGPGDNYSNATGGIGAAWVFTRSGSTWTQQGSKLTANDETGGGAAFGMSVALSSDGNTALIGGGSDNSGVGAAWVFTRSGSTWTQQGSKLTGIGETGTGGFGQSVSLSANGTTALIGGGLDNSNAGAAWVFIHTGSGWVHQGPKLTPSGETGAGKFGASLSLSGDGNTALIGGPLDNSFSGAAWVFTRSGSTWAQQGSKLTPSDASPPGGSGPEFGFAVALASDGSTALIGAPMDNSGRSGSAWVFARSGSSWTQQGSKLIPNDEPGTDGSSGFGWSVALSGDGRAAVIGSQASHSSGDPGTGAAWLFTRSGSTWRQTGARTDANGVSEFAGFGWSAAVSSDGTTALLGAPGDSGPDTPPVPPGVGVGTALAFVLPPVSTSPPTISGTAASGQTLTESHASWNPAATGYTYQWQDCDASGANCSPISGATSQTYTLTSADAGHTIVVQETASNAGGPGLAAASAATTMVPPVATSPPTIIATPPRVGQTLIEAHGSWNGNPTGYSYQWQDCDGSSCSSISGATGQQYTPTTADAGHAVRVLETAANAGGPGNASSSAITAIIPPYATSPATISGNTTQGQTLIESHGSWAGSPTSYTIVWKRCDESYCTTIDGATGQNYTLTSADAGFSILVLETASNGGGPGFASVSNETAVVAPLAPVNVSPPTIKGPAEIGQTLTEVHGNWTNNPTGYTYQWESCNAAGQNCSQISGQTSQTYVVKTGDAGKTFAVLETAANQTGRVAALSATTAPVPPSGPVGVLMNSGDYATNNPKVTVGLVWPAGAKLVVLSNDGGFGSTGNARTFTLSNKIPWTLKRTGSDRLPKIVYVRFIGAGIDLVTFTDDIVLDETAPTVQSAQLIGAKVASVSARAARATGHRYAIRLKARDPIVGICTVQVSSRRSGGTTVRLADCRSQGRLRVNGSIHFTAGPTPRYVRVRNAAGSWSRWKKVS